MASGFFAILDDIATLMDDVATMSKIATKKTAGILGDDLAVNAEKATGFLSNREIPVLWAITKGSFRNKLIILPIAFLLSAYLPLAITIILILGGVYLAYEGAEKVYEYFFHRKEEERKEELLSVPEEKLPELEKKKIKQGLHNRWTGHHFMKYIHKTFILQMMVSLVQAFLGCTKSTSL